ncbi:hypothetical protein BLA14095_01033 [Burkholderia lata]|uniref:PAAR domain-containing protein n=1 Tax=Burkholderia lata (strain ATCC 17760 / DSM 23089 / LMG 22485 / NCIMB 9086 / R18194 / 383) TaxID=482957 RepID=UPI001452B713|nr:PAAR domain-containing protein [Burkholderia lata]VWB27548.1 hypothetical protein BLA14095_01033 [Burkholderia lata]
MKNEHKAPTYLFATIGALTERGGRVTTATSSLTLAGLEVACVGDVVTYDDGSEAAIIDGAGNNHSGGKPFALVGSRLSNGDRIIETLRTSWGIHVRNGQSVEGLFDPTYVPSPAARAYRLAVRGATTARGGALREPSSTWQVTPHLGKAAVLGDLIHYPDGSTARVISGLGLADRPDFAPLAFVGSELDNGDTITDSPERQGAAVSVVFSVVTRSPMSH